MHGRQRAGTRIKCEISVRLDPLDSPHLQSGPCLIIVANPQGCGVRFNHPLEIGTRVRLEGLPEKCSVTARVVNCISPFQFPRRCPPRLEPIQETRTSHIRRARRERKVNLPGFSRAIFENMGLALRPGKQGYLRTPSAHSGVALSRRWTVHRGTPD